MLLRHTLLAILTAGLLMAASSVIASQDRAGVIRAVDQASQQVTIDEQRYRINHHTQVNNLSGADDGLQTGYPVVFSAEHGALKQITIYPKSAAKRRELGYRTQHDFPQ